MPDDTNPITTTVPETVSVDTGADKESIASITDSFSDFWKEEDAKEGAPEEKPSDAPAAPAAPGEGAAQETRDTEPAVSGAETKPRSSEPELSDEEIDRMQLPPTARPEHIADFRKMREQVIMARKQFRAEAAEKAKIEAQLNEARQNAWTPEQKADYEHAAQVRRRFDVGSDPEFLQRFHVPVQQTFENVLEEAVEALPDKQAARQWADHIKANYRPDQLDKNWWLNDVAAKVPNELERTQFLNSVSQLHRLQRERDAELSRRSGDKSSLENWITEKNQFTAQRVQQEIMSEIGIQEQRLAEIMPRDVTQAKTAEERQAIEAHNDRFNRLNEKFQGFVKDILANGPRGSVRTSVEATRALVLDEENKSLASELKSVKTERDQLKKELDKITGARRKLSQTTGTPPASANKKDGGLSIRDLDVRKAFDKFSWDDGNT
jgi:hypothetical protein